MIQPRLIITRCLLGLAVLAAVLLLVAGPGTRMQLWDFRAGFSLLRWATYFGLASAAVALLMLLVPRLRRPHGVSLAIALLLGLGVSLVPLNIMREAQNLPPIHDISTDTAHPPAFVTILPLRADAPNSAEYGGPDIARQQLMAYPDVRAHTTAQAPHQAFDHALETAQGMGWEIVASDRSEGRIEATDTTPWFGFKDDVVIRITSEGTGSKVDVRSVSRVGKGDVGANARRVLAYLKALREHESAATVL